MKQKEINIVIKTGLLNIDELDKSVDFFYIRKITSILNIRMKELRQEGVYFSMCYPSFHRKEVYIALLFSEIEKNNNVILAKVNELLYRNISDSEISIYEKREENNDDENIITYKERMTVMYDNEGITKNSIPENLDFNEFKKYLIEL